VLPTAPAAPADDGHYVTLAILAAVTQSQSHVSATPTPAPAAPSTGVSLASREIPISSHAPGMAKYYAPVYCPPLPAQPSQSSMYMWPDSLVDVAIAPVPPLELTSPQPTPPAAPEPADEPLFFSPSPPPAAALPRPPAQAIIAPIPVDSAANCALSSMAMGRTLAEDLMDIEVGVPLPSLVNPVLRNPLVGNGDETDDLLFSHVRPLQGDALIRAAGVLPEELLPGPPAKNPVPSIPALEQSAPTQPSTAPPTQEPSYIVEPPLNTYDDPSLTRSLSHLAGLSPPSVVRLSLSS